MSGHDSMRRRWDAPIGVHDDPAQLANSTVNRALRELQCAGYELPIEFEYTITDDCVTIRFDPNRGEPPP